MNQSELLERARYGNPGAIAALLNHSLEPKGIMATVNFQGICLQVILESETPPDPERLTTFIKRGLTTLNSPLISQVEIQAQPRGHAHPAWTETFNLDVEATPPSASPGAASLSESAAPLGLKDRARQGDSEAIATLFNRAIAGKGITVTVALQDRCLQVELAATRLPDDGLVNVLIHRELSSLRSPLIQSVQISGRAADQPTPGWTQEFVAKPIGDGSLYIQYVPLGQEDEDLPTSGSRRGLPPPPVQKHGSAGSRSGKRGTVTSPMNPRTPLATPPAPQGRDPILERKLLSCGCHLSVYLGWGLLGLLIPIGFLLLVPDSIVNQHAKEVLNLYLNLLGWGILALGLMLIVPPLGFIWLWAIAGYSVVTPILAVLSCWTQPEEIFHYPLTTRIL